MERDDIFKFWYAIYIFSILPKFKLTWQQELEKMNDLWELAGKLIDHECFYNSFKNYCSDENLVSDGYDFKSAFQYANTTWRDELMADVATKIVAFYD